MARFPILLRVNCLAVERISHNYDPTTLWRTAFVR